MCQKAADSPTAALLLDLTTESNYFMLTVLSLCVTVSASHSVSLSTCAKGAATKTTQYFLILPRMLIALTA